MNIIEAEYIDYMHGYRVYRPSKPQITMAWFDTLEEAERECREQLGEIIFKEAKHD